MASLDDVDNCPTVPNPDQANYDGDDLGDACDLDLAGSADRVLVFEPFVSTLGLLGGPHSWEFSGGDTVITHGANALLSPPLLPTRVVVRFGIDHIGIGRDECARVRRRRLERQGGRRLQRERG